MKVSNLWTWDILLLQAIHTEVKDVGHEGVVLVFLLLHNGYLGPSSVHLTNRQYFTMKKMMYQRLMKYIFKS